MFATHERCGHHRCIAFLLKTRTILASVPCIEVICVKMISKEDIQEYSYKLALVLKIIKQCCWLRCDDLFQKRSLPCVMIGSGSVVFRLDEFLVKQKATIRNTLFNFIKGNLTHWLKCSEQCSKLNLKSVRPNCHFSD